jgi:poly(3-hydroxybutyrate) depolymerase
MTGGKTHMRYALFDLFRETLRPALATLSMGEAWARSPRNPLSDTIFGRLQASTFESAHRLLRPYPKQPWAYPSVTLDGEAHPVYETVVQRKPFCNLLKFERAGLPSDAPKVLFVAALSGHYATLSRETYQEFLPDHQVYVTDWLNARDVPLAEGRFGFEEYVSYLIEFLEAIGPDAHFFAVCQAAVPALVATAIMSEARNEYRPRSLILMAGPMDVRVNPSAALKHSQQLSINLLRRTAIHTVPSRFAGAGRRVYPGAQQLMGFMSLNPRLHLRKHIDFYKDMIFGNHTAARKHRDFYDEYFAVLDTTEEFYLETIERIFLDQHLPKGLMQYHGKTVTCAGITDVPILTLEGAEDDMVGVGQTQAALKLCKNLPDAMKEAYVQPGVGHYGIFAGERYRRETAPRAKAFFEKYRTARPSKHNGHALNGAARSGSAGAPLQQEP